MKYMVNKVDIVNSVIKKVYQYIVNSVIKKVYQYIIIL
jgi:hypothetical protein